MKRLLFCLFVLSSFVASGQVRPDQAAIQANPDTSNFEVYGQKDGNLRRAKLDAIGDFILDNYTMVYDSAENRIRITAFGQAVDTLELTGSSGVTVTLSGDDLTIDGTTIDLSDYDGSLSYNSSTYVLSHVDGGTTENVSLATLVRDLSYNNSTLYLKLGQDSVDMSDLRQELSYNSSTNVLTLDNGGGSVTLSSSGLSSVSSASYFGGAGTSADPLTIDDAGITFAKIESVPSSTLMGRYSTGSGELEELTFSDDFELSGSGVFSLNDTVSLTIANDQYRKYKDTTVYSSGGDIASAEVISLIERFDEVRIDMVIESGASSNFIINFPNANADTSYREKTVVINAIDESSSYEIQVSNVENVTGQIKSLSDDDNITLKSMGQDGTFQWLLVASNEFDQNEAEGFFEVDSINVVGLEDNITISTNSAGDPIVATLTVTSPEDIRSANIVVNTTKDFTLRVTDSSGSTNNDASDLWMPTINVYDISSIDLSGTTGSNVSHNSADFIPSAIDWSTANSIDITFGTGDYSSKSKLLIVMTW